MPMLFWDKEDKLITSNKKISRISRKMENKTLKTECLGSQCLKNKLIRFVLNARNHVIEFYAKSGYKAVRKYEGSDTEFLTQLWKNTLVIFFV